MKNIARLVIFFTGSFALILLIAASVHFTEVWIGAGEKIPAQSMDIVPEIFNSIHAVLSFTLYFSLLLTLSYTVRRKIPAPAAIPLVFVLALTLTTAAFTGGARLPAPENRSLRSPAASLGAPGLILTQGNISMVLLEEPSKEEGRRVVALPGQTLLYQEKPVGPGRRPLPLPPAPFNRELPYFFQSIKMDFALGVKLYDSFMARGLGSFILHIGALTLLLCSLRGVFGVSVWPMANLFLGALVFRGILSLELFINSPEVHDFLGKFTGNRITGAFLGPMILGGLALLVIFYSLLIHLARKKKAENG